jgi:hypothetical protein
MEMVLLRGLKEFLPRAAPRRGLINAGGSLLKVLFGVSTVADIESLRSTVDKLHRKEDTIVHSLNQQVTYLKQLDESVKFNSQAIGSLTNALKSVAFSAKEGLQDVASKLAWYNKQQETATIVRELEFATAKLEISINELIDAVQIVLLGNVPMNLVKPNVLRDMLKNVTMILPENLELIASLNPNNMYLYYDMIRAMVLTHVHSFKRVLYVPLKTVNRQFELYEVVVFPARIFNTTYAKFVVEEEYFAVNLLQHTYFAMSGAEISKCKGKDILICPANQAVYSMEVKSCILSLYLLSSEAREFCKRTLFTRPAPSSLERHGQSVLYYVAELQALHVQCRLNRTW